MPEGAVTEGRARWALAESNAAAFVAVEIASIFIAGVPVGVGVLFAALFAVVWFLLRRRSLGGVIGLAVLSLIEVAFVPMYERNDAGDWALQVLAAVLGIVGLAAASAVFVARRRDRRLSNA